MSIQFPASSLYAFNARFSSPVNRWKKLNSLLLKWKILPHTQQLLLLWRDSSSYFARLNDLFRFFFCKKWNISYKHALYSNTLVPKLILRSNLTVKRVGSYLWEKLSSYESYDWNLAKSIRTGLERFLNRYLACIWWAIKPLQCLALMSCGQGHFLKARLHWRFLLRF